MKSLEKFNLTELTEQEALNVNGGSQLSYELGHAVGECINTVAQAANRACELIYGIFS